MPKLVYDKSKSTQDFDMIDLHEADHVEFKVDGDGKCWLNLNGKCLLRVGKVDEVVIEDDRSPSITPR